MCWNIVRSCALLAVGSIVSLALVAWSGVEAAPSGPQQPFRNAVEQREEMIRELQDIKLLLKEQNALLRTFVAKATAHGPKP